MKRTILLISFLINLSLLQAQDRVTGKNFATRSEVIAENAMAATSHPLATQVALQVMREGGNAIDAAIAANATLGLMEPTGNGIGGDLFAIIWDAETKKLYGLNASGRSPQSLTLEYFKENGFEGIPAYGPLPVSVPGCVDGWNEMHQRFGSMEWEKLFDPAISYAREGFPVTELIAFYMDLSSRRLGKYPGFKETYMPGGQTPRKGGIFKNPDLANTLELIAKEGRDAFYKGKIADAIVAIMEDQGGFITKEDLAAHTSEWVEPVSTDYRGYDVWELPPNGQGIAALQILNILEQYDIAEMGFGSQEYIHTFVEAKKLAYEDRAKYYADPAFNEIPVQELISKEYAKKRKELIDDNRAARSYPAGKLGHGETIYMTTADAEGNMVSLIQSNYRGMGSGMIPPGTGFILQDRGELFSLEPGHFNVYEPGKRPFHTIIPCFVTKDGKPFISFGVMGGAMQPQGHAQIVVNMIDFGMNLQEAGDAPRIQHLGSSQPTDEVMTDGGTVYLESGIDYETLRNLRMMGHQLGINVGGYGGYQAIMWDDENGVYFGASESRKDGQAAGY
ncbi:MAG TPA: gamma-glutamyltransferase [Cytophagales bacterium]|jgi:gamma-glutamyltranspeptidase/glutathione hydrolase|nr:gamma-glutamyltransferase [Cytophagales bacterium]